jgi:hypothetical protein
MFGHWVWYFLIGAWLGFTRFAVASEQWKASALFFAVAVWMLEWAFGAPFATAMLFAAAAGAASGLHYWALVRYLDIGFFWFVLLLAGFVGVFWLHSLLKALLLG